MRIRKTFKAEMAHRLVGAFSEKCLSIHGHSYEMEVELETDSLDEYWMVMDFGYIKQQGKDFMDAWDHSLV